MAEEPTYRGIQAEYKGTPVTVYSTTGQNRTEAEFNTALQHYSDTKGESPEGFIVLTPADRARRVYEQSINQPMQRAAGSAGETVAQTLAPTGFGYLAGKLGLISPQTAQQFDRSVGQFGREEGQSLAETVNTPGKMGAAIGMAGSTFVPGVGIVPNIVKTALGATAGAAALKTATGEPATPGDLAPHFIQGALTGTMQGVLSHFMTKYLSPDLQEKVATDIFNTMKSRYPNLANNPSTFEAYASSKEGLQGMSQHLAEGLRGSVDKMADATLQSIKGAALPRGLSVGEQATLRARIRDFTLAGNTYLNDIGAGKDIGPAVKALDVSRQGIMDYLTSVFPKLNPAAQVKLTAELAQQQRALDTFQEGVQVLRILRESSGTGGFNPVAFAKGILGEKNPTPLLNQVANKLGMGNTLTIQQGQASPAAQVGSLLWNSTLGKLPFLPRATAKGPEMLPWQVPQPQSIPGAIGQQQLIRTIVGSQQGQQAGQDAIDSFLGKGQK